MPLMASLSFLNPKNAFQPLSPLGWGEGSGGAVGTTLDPAAGGGVVVSTLAFGRSAAMVAAAACASAFISFRAYNGFFLRCLKKQSCLIKNSPTLYKYNSGCIRAVNSVAVENTGTELSHRKELKAGQPKLRDKSAAQLKCMYTNSRSIGKKQVELEAIVQQESYDVAAITEIGQTPTKTAAILFGAKGATAAAARPGSRPRRLPGGSSPRLLEPTGRAGPACRRADRAPTAAAPSLRCEPGWRRRGRASRGQGAPPRPGPARSFCLCHVGAGVEELSALAAIYCEPDACEVLAVSETHGITFRIQISVKELLDTDVLLKLKFHLPVNYPSTLPDISVNSDQLTRAQCMDVKDKLLEQANKHLSETVVHDLILWIQQHLQYVIKQSDCNKKPALSKQASTEDGTWMLLLHLDHMRAKAKYAKNVEKWASDLRLTGRLIFMGKIILILLQGDKNNIKEYLILQKTSKVDVDSSGKKCREKMISVLCETNAQSQHKSYNLVLLGIEKFQTFEIKECSTLNKLQKEFETAGLKTLFSEFVPPLLK
ncbi:LOW QUALITY PROTEIN: RWD domain-containing protein 3 [Phaethornis superciliosus]